MKVEAVALLLTCALRLTRTSAPGAPPTRGGNQRGVATPSRAAHRREQLFTFVCVSHDFGPRAVREAQEPSTVRVCSMRPPAQKPPHTHRQRTAHRAHNMSNLSASMIVLLHSASTKAARAPPGHARRSRLSLRICLTSVSRARSGARSGSSLSTFSMRSRACWSSYALRSKSTSSDWLLTASLRWPRS